MATFGIPSLVSPITPSLVFPTTFATATSTITTSTTSTTTTDDSDVDDNYNQAQDTSSSTSKAISIGWIVAIVFGVLAVMSAVITGVRLYRRNGKRKRETAAQLAAEPKPGDADQGSPVSTSALGYGGPSELVGQEPPPRHEVPNTEVLPREMPDNEVARPPPPKDETPLDQRVELPA
ncbi:hypothetical protein GGR53DRAFT_527714 [Hypoxylon sp. FL1150]|nr:hypothetical protein GGR53DRAFT_527714 [Hypoxylon sp. FL1150]